MANSNLVTREDLANVFGALGEGSYETRIDALEEKANVVGTLYTGTLITNSVPNTTATQIMSLTLPAGLYIVVGNCQWAVAVNGMSITELTGINNVPIVRDSSYENSAGGGCSISSIANLTTQTTVYLRVYQNSGATKTLNRLELHAVRLA